MQKVTLKFTAVFSLIIFCVLSSPAQNGNSSECVRARPARILSREVYPQAKFKLVKNKSFPFEYVGYETARLKNGDDLTIKNYGCENYSLDFQFETSRFVNNSNRTIFWYQAAVKLMNSINDGLIKDEYLPVKGTKALSSYIGKSKTVRFNKEIDFGGTEIRDVVFLPPVRKGRKGKFIVEVSFGTGPL